MVAGTSDLRSQVGSNWLSEHSVPTFSHEVALDPTSEAGLKKNLGKMRATGVLT